MRRILFRIHQMTYRNHGIACIVRYAMLCVGCSIYIHSCRYCAPIYRECFYLYFVNYFNIATVTAQHNHVGWLCKSRSIFFTIYFEVGRKIPDHFCEKIFNQFCARYQHAIIIIVISIYVTFVCVICLQFPMAFLSNYYLHLKSITM